MTEPIATARIAAADAVDAYARDNPGTHVIPSALIIGLSVNAAAPVIASAAREEGRRAGWAEAVAALREHDTVKERQFVAAVRLDPDNWDGWPYAHPYREAADYLADQAPKEETHD